MKFSICLSGEPEQLPYLPEIMSLDAGLELQSYGLKGIRSQQEWDTRIARHREILKTYKGPLAFHGPFLGLNYNHIDAVINEAVNKRMNMFFAVASEFKPGTVVLHTNYSLTDKETEWNSFWLKKTVDYWKKDIKRWELKGIRVALENSYERDAGLTKALIDDVNSPALGACLDVGHCNLFSRIPAESWIQALGPRIFHVHLHDNDGTGDQHLPVGQGKIDFGPIFKSLTDFAPGATLALEAHTDIKAKIENLKYIRRLI
jgi:sugar phosphate isomerase/epimerase